ncbi:porin family protein [Mariniflexile gromovii]|uniref:PorT family protein n=1 Tax=Mariniflexile gromovii TaxID=362523 RepID=A0ABS4BSN9_9FLAO|nr:porin family protein [Mariniflexile gromovii]MBP0903594.1 PorT family protein [Mariniflexile gromovii]
MKYYILLSLLLLGIFVNAQDNQGVIGIKGGLNLATFTGAEDVDFSRIISFNLGIMLETKLSESISLQPEILLSAQGSKASIDSQSADNRLYYLNLPILLKFYTSDRFSFDIGPQLGILISAKQKSSSSSSTDNDIKTLFSDNDIGLITGISYKFVSGINFSARYNFGLKNIINTNLYSNENKLKNGVFQLSIGYYFKK